MRLACDLLGKPAGVIAPSFFRAELERVRTSSLQLASNARFESLLGDPARALLRAVRAHELHPSEHSERALKDAYRAAILHHVNRRASSLITGSGPSYLAGRWKQGEVFVETSPDGRWRALVTERGIDGGNPPGDVYLMSNETLRAIKLKRPRARVAASRTSASSRTRNDCSSCATSRSSCTHWTGESLAKRHSSAGRNRRCRWWTVTYSTVSSRARIPKVGCGWSTPTTTTHIWSCERVVARRGRRARHRARRREYRDRARINEGSAARARTRRQPVRRCACRNRCAVCPLHVAACARHRWRGRPNPSLRECQWHVARIDGQ